MRVVLLVLGALLVADASLLGIRARWANRCAAAVIGLSSLTSPAWVTPLPAYADARLNAPTAAGTRVNRDAESLLRFGLPFDCKEARELQDAIENVKNNLKVRELCSALLYLT